MTVFRVGLAVSFLLVSAPPNAPAEGQTELTPNSIMTVAERIAFNLEDYQQFRGTLVCRTPGMDQVTIVNVTYDPDDESTADLYYPPARVAPSTDGLLRSVAPDRLESGRRFPVFILPMGFRLSHWLTQFPYSPRDDLAHIDMLAMFASQGVVAVCYETERIDGGMERLMEFLVDHESQLGLDTSRIGLLSWSGHGRLAGKVISGGLLGDSLQCVVSIHSDIQVMVMPNRPLQFYVVHSGGDQYGDAYGKVLARRAAALGHGVIEISEAPYKNFQFEEDTPETRAIMHGAAEFAREWLMGTADQGPGS